MQKCTLLKANIVLLTIFSINKANIKDNINSMLNIFSRLQLIEVLKSNLIMLKVN